jgi:hypothetical protein
MQEPNNNQEKTEITTRKQAYSFMTGVTVLGLVSIAAPILPLFAVCALAIPCIVSPKAWGQMKQMLSSTKRAFGDAFKIIGADVKKLTTQDPLTPEQKQSLERFLDKTPSSFEEAKSLTTSFGRKTVAAVKSAVTAAKITPKNDK